jgi:phosphatidate cytidylyltransferase
LIQFLYHIHWSVAAVIFVMLWFNDAGAYIIGSAVGKHKLCEKISPSKTWEGFFGGMIATLIVAFGTYCLSHCSLFIIHCSFNHIWFCLVFAAIVSIFGTFGDLFESMLKRQCAVKDSGKIMPGHGGALDRFDSLLFAIIAISILYSILCIYTKKVI